MCARQAMRQVVEAFARAGQPLCGQLRQAAFDAGELREQRAPVGHHEFGGA